MQHLLLVKSNRKPTENTRNYGSPRFRHCHSGRRQGHAPAVALAKVLHRAGGRTLVEHVVRACQPLKPRAIVAVVGHQAEQVSAVLEPLGVRTVLQQPQRGTGHAMLVARRALGSAPNSPSSCRATRRWFAPKRWRRWRASHRQSGAAATILSAEVANPAGYGRILRREDGTVAAIVEDSALTDDQRAINEINSSIYAFTLAKLWPCLARLRPTTCTASFI